MIIGGGVAGISAAMNLWDKADVTLCESANRLGGRISSRIDKTTGDSIDNGQHLLIGAYSEFLKILRISGSLDQVKTQDDFYIKYYSPSKFFALDGTKLPGDLGLLYGLLKLPIKSKEKINAIKFIIRIKLGLIKDFNNCYEMLKYYNQIGNIYKIFWEPMILATLNTAANEASPELLLNVLKMGFFASGNNKKLIFPKVGLSDLLINTEKYLENKIKLKLNTSVTDIKIEKERIFAKINSEFVEFDKIISALPLRRASSLFKWEELEKYSNQYKSIVSIYLWYDKKFFPDKFAAFYNTNTQWTFNKRKLGFSEGEKDFPEFLTITISDADLNKKELMQNIVYICDNELKNIFPKAKNAKLLHSKVIKEKFATFPATNEFQNWRKSLSEFHPKIKFIGDWTYLKFPSTIEGAARSGRIKLEDI